MRKAITSEYRRVNGVRLHVLRATRALGRPLPDGAVVHHADGSKGDDAPLVICENEQYHRLLHVLLRVRAAGGNPWQQRICYRCQQLRTFDQFVGDVHRRVGRCHECNRRHVREGRNKRKAMAWAS